MLVARRRAISNAPVNAWGMDGPARVAIEKNPRNTTVSFQTLTGHPSRPRRGGRPGAHDEPGSRGVVSNPGHVEPASALGAGRRAQHVTGNHSAQRTGGNSPRGW